MAQPTAQEQLMLELVNLARSNPNAEAARHGISLNQGVTGPAIASSAKQPLAFNFNLINAARGHSQWLIDSDVDLTHTGAGGSSIGDRIVQSGYSSIGNIAENLASNGSTASLDLSATIADQQQRLFRSVGHRVNLLGSSFREIGIGALSGNYQGFNHSLVTTQKLATAHNTAFLTGVLYNDAVLNDDFYSIGEGLSGITVQATRTDNNQQFSTTTHGSGGYQLALAPGTYEISFFGGGLGQTFQRYVTIAQRNLKLDLATDLPVALQPLRVQGQTPAFNSAMLAWDKVTTMVSSFRIDSGSRTAIANPMGRTIEDTNWQLQTTGDLNGDGQDDVLLRNFVAGQNLLWEMTPFGEAIAAERLIGRDVPDPNWSLSGTGDFDNDGQTDILLRNENADQIVVWYMNRNGTIKAESLVGRGFGDNNWKIEATADFNNDGQTDILLRNALAGQTLLWTMNGAAIASEALVGRSVGSLDWQIEGAKDFSGDGRVDLFWRHLPTGQGLLWQMQSPTQIAQEQFITNVPNGSSQLVF